MKKPTNFKSNITQVANQSSILLRCDYKRYPQKRLDYTRIYLYFYRKSNYSKNILLNLFYKLVLKLVSQLHGMEISSKKTGKGLYIGHPYNITINKDVIIGENCSIHKGVTIGQENRGKRKGTPQIGNMVWIGINATIVGNIRIGNDVLIAPNSYVNVDIPSHSVVLGNPCIICHKENATENYLNNLV